MANPGASMYGRSLVELARELERQLGTKKDLLAPLPRTHHPTAEDGERALEIEEPDGVRRYGITPLARRQLAEKLKIPYAYFERMRTEQPELLDRNAWLEREEGERQLLRTLDGKVRAVLSERYRRLDNYDLLEHVLPTLQHMPDLDFEPHGKRLQGQNQGKGSWAPLAANFELP
jgi:hypothetical protein